MKWFLSHCVQQNFHFGKLYLHIPEISHCTFQEPWCQQCCWGSSCWGSALHFPRTWFMLWKSMNHVCRFIPTTAGMVTHWSCACLFTLSDAISPVGKRPLGTKFLPVLLGLQMFWLCNGYIVDQTLQAYDWLCELLGPVLVTSPFTGTHF